MSEEPTNLEKQPEDSVQHEQEQQQSTTEPQIDEAQPETQIETKLEEDQQPQPTESKDEVSEAIESNKDEKSSNESSKQPSNQDPPSDEEIHPNPKEQSPDKELIKELSEGPQLPPIEKDIKVSNEPPSSEEPKESDADDQNKIADGKEDETLKDTKVGPILEENTVDSSDDDDKDDGARAPTVDEINASASAAEDKTEEKPENKPSDESIDKVEDKANDHQAEESKEESKESKENSKELKEPSPEDNLESKSDEKSEDKPDDDGDISIPDANNSEYENESGPEEDDEDGEPSDVDADDSSVRKSKSRSRTAEPPKIKDEENDSKVGNESNSDHAGNENQQEGGEGEGQEAGSKDQEMTDSNDNNNINNNDHNTTKDDEEEIKEEPYIPQTHTIVIPSYASWFDLTKIHPIEKESLPEFFKNQNPSKTPQIYVKYRNFLVNAYRLNPNDYLTVTAARRNLVGDVGTILRVHRFLSRWGLINYQVDASEKPKPVEPPFTGDYNVTYDAPRGLFPFESFKPSLEQPKLEKLKEISRGQKRELNGDGEKKQDNEEKLKEGDDHVNGNDFKKPKIAKTINDGWSKDDLKKLLEGLTKFKGDWDSISSHVGTKTIEQCIIRFLKLPIEDEFLENSKENLGPLKYAPYLPFSQADNPVLSTVAFLVSLVDPEVVKAATSNAIKIIDEKDVSQALEIEEKGESGVSNGVEESAKIALSTIGARSHVFKTNEEIEMNKLTNVIVNTQLNKFELKMSKLESIEKELDLEKKILQRQQEELFLDRLSFSKTSSSVLNKLNNALEKAQTLSITPSSTTELSKLIEEAKNLLANPLRSELSSFDLSKRDPTVQPETTEENENGTSTIDDDLKPISIEAPQTYRYWSG